VAERGEPTEAKQSPSVRGGERNGRVSWCRGGDPAGDLTRIFPDRHQSACLGLWERRSTLNKEEKGQVIADLKEKFSRAKAVVFTDYKGMTVAELTELRRLLKKSSLDYRVVKNTLAKIAAQDTDVMAAERVFKGPIGIAVGYDDPVLVVKKVLEFAKTNEKIQVRGAVVEGRLCEPAEVKEIADLPSREVLLSMVAGAFQAPLSKMAGALSATVSSFAYAVQALQNKKEN
jgi:large subunit ribosomal protein L10